MRQQRDQAADQAVWTKAEIRLPNRKALLTIDVNLHSFMFGLMVVMSLQNFRASPVPPQPFVAVAFVHASLLVQSTSSSSILGKFLDLTLAKERILRCSGA